MLEEIPFRDLERFWEAQKVKEMATFGVKVGNATSAIVQ